jgi:hypothetical protein
MSLPFRRSHPTSARLRNHLEVELEGSGIMLDHERLDVYQLARELARVGNTVVQQVPSGRADLIDQFRRTTLSIPLNIAEGGGEYAPRENPVSTGSQSDPQPNAQPSSIIW